MTKSVLCSIIKTKEYKENTNGTFSRKKIDREDFFSVVGEKQAWLIGFIAADGSIGKRNQVNFSQSGDEGLQLVKIVKSMLGVHGQIYEYKPKKGRVSYSISFTSDIICADLSRYEIVPRKSLTYKFPSTLDVSVYPHFIRGYIDGDGCVGIYGINRSPYLLVSWCGSSDFIEECSERVPFNFSSKTNFKRSPGVSEIRYYGRKAVDVGRWIWQARNLPETKKIKIYKEFLSDYFPSTKYAVYQRKKEMAYLLLDEGMSPLNISALIGVSFETVYKWRRQREHTD